MSTRRRNTTEARLSKAVVQLAEWYGFRVFTILRSDRAVLASNTGAGWPDLFIAGHGRAIAVELKSATGRLTPMQKSWLNELKAAGIETHIWRPADLQSGLVERTFSEALTGETT